MKVLSKSVSILDRNSQEYFVQSYESNLELFQNLKQSTFQISSLINDLTESQQYTDKMSFDLMFQNEIAELPAVAKSIWHQTSTAAIEAAKVKEKQQWYTEAIGRSVIEPWTAAL